MLRTRGGCPRPRCCGDELASPESGMTSHRVAPTVVVVGYWHNADVTT